jgi:DNA-binding CsgD family transcriptional regulator
MRQALAVSPLTDDERQQLKAGLRSPKAFTLRRCQILLAIVEGETPARIAHILGCTRETVNHVINDYSSRP